MTVLQKELALASEEQFQLINITPEVADAVSQSGIQNGVAVVFAPHTTAAVRINHDEPLLKQDIMKLLYRLAPMDLNYAHDIFEIREKVKPDERSNGHAHVKAFLLGSSQTVPVAKGKLVLGERQSIFFVEFDGARKRRAIVQILGE